MSQKAIEEARKWIGTPYRHQASARMAGADCLGLIRGVWRALYGEEPEVIPAYTPDWSEGRGEEVLWRAALRNLELTETQRSGQVLLFRMREGTLAKHLGISAVRHEMPTFIHSYSGHGVCESALSAPWARRVVARFEFPEEA